MNKVLVNEVSQEEDKKGRASYVGIAAWHSVIVFVVSLAVTYIDTGSFFETGLQIPFIVLFSIFLGIAWPALWFLAVLFIMDSIMVSGVGQLIIQLFLDFIK